MSIIPSPGEMPKKPKAVVLLSGGMDSCVTAAIANETYRIALLHASYGQRTEQRERRAFDEIADFYKVSDRLVVRLDSLSQIGGSALTDARIPVPESEGASAGGTSEIPITYVPFRNAHFLSAAVSWAEVIGARGLHWGRCGRQFRLSGLPAGVLPGVCGGRARWHPPGDTDPNCHASDRHAQGRNCAARACPGSTAPFDMVMLSIRR